MNAKPGKATLLGAALVAAGGVLAASLVVGTEREPRSATGAAARAGASAEPHTEQRGLAKGVLVDLDLSRLNRAPVGEIEDGLFPVRVPKAPPSPIPAQVVIQAPPPPPARSVAPPLPFRYLGLMEDRGQLIVFVARGDELLSLKPGDVVANQYRVDAADEASVTFVYLPLDEKQVLAFGRRQ